MTVPYKRCTGVLPYTPTLNIAMQSNTYTKLQEKLGEDRVSEHKDITFYFTMRTVAKAEYFFAAETREEIGRAHV